MSVNVEKIIKAGEEVLEANKPVNKAYGLLEGFSKKHDVIGAPVSIAKSYAEGKNGIKEVLFNGQDYAWETLNKKRAIATAAGTWVAGNAAIGMVRGVFTDRNGNFDMPLVPFV